MTELVALPGNPAELARYASRYSQLAESILDTARRLSTFVDDRNSIGESADAVRTQSADVAGQITRAEPRYRETAVALADYATVLDDAQRTAAQAVAAGTREQDELRPLEHRRQELAGELQRIMLYPASPHEYDDYQREVHQLDARIGSIEASLGSAITQYQRAVAERDHAAEVAISRIDSVLGTLNDGLLDHVSAALDSVGDFMSAVAHWIDKVLVPILLDILLVLQAIGLALTLLAAVLAFLPLVLVFVVGVATGNISLTDFENALIRGLLVALPILLPALALMLAREALTPTPKVTREQPYLGRQTIKDTPTSYGGEMAYNGTLDSDGGTSSTEIGIVEVLDADGNRIGWRVTLPSTQDWELAQGALEGKPDPTTDQGAVNDLGSNLALMMTPDQKAAYERAVIEAMKQAGIGPNDPVMLCGWSQGGILAARMASDPSVPFTVKAIYVAGAPIDGMDIPRDVSVISLQHQGDVVHTLDGTPAQTLHDGTRDNWVTIAPPSPKPGPPHNNAMYSQTAATAIDANPTPQVQHVVDLQSQFFSTNEVEHRFTTHE